MQLLYDEKCYGQDRSDRSGSDGLVMSMYYDVCDVFCLVDYVFESPVVSWIYYTHCVRLHSHVVYVYTVHVYLSL